MGLLFLTVVATATTVGMLRGGRAEAPTWRLLVAWLSGIAAIWSAVALFILTSSPDWDDPDAPSIYPLIGPAVEEIGATVSVALSTAYMLWLRRKPPFIYIALPILGLVICYWVVILLFHHWL
jgi:uncharacterized membrane protein YccC